MLSTFTGIEMGKRGLIGHEQGFVTVGHNLNNEGVEGYSRQRIIMSASAPIYVPGLTRENTAGHIGQGIDVQRVERVRDMLLEDTIIGETGRAGYWDSADNWMLRLDQVYNEPTNLVSDTSLINNPDKFTIRDLTDEFWASWQDLSARPTEISARQAVVQRGKNLVEGVNNTYRRLKEIRDMLDGDITGTVKQINDLTAKIASLNEVIGEAEGVGDNPNDLYDKRDLAVEQLGKLIDVHVVRTDPDEFIVYTNGRHIVQGTIHRELGIRRTAENEGYARVTWAGTDEPATFAAGKLRAMIDIRDIDARQEIQKLDVFTMNFIDSVNSIHRKGFGSNGRTGLDFFNEVPFVTNVNGNYDRSGDGNFDSSYVFRLTGSHELSLHEHVGVAGTMTFAGPAGNITVAYNPADTVEDVIHRINFSGAEVAAGLDEAGKLVLKAVPSQDSANPDFVLRHVEDSGQFLAGYAGLLSGTGAANAYDWQQADAVLGLAENTAFATAPIAHPSGWMRVNETLERDAGSVAGSFGHDRVSDGIGDGSAALAISQIRQKQVTVGESLTYSDYFAEMIASVGLRSEAAAKFNEMEKQILKNHHDTRQAISGVNINEELTEMVKYQHGYNAAARVVTEFDKMLDVIINRMGV